MWTTDRFSNRLDGGAYYYGSYECSDGKHISIGSLEPQFYALLLEKAEITDPEFKDQLNEEAWPAKRKKLEELSKQNLARNGAISWKGLTFALLLS
jgi:alpha-methylacyl-CoA racemase